MGTIDLNKPFTGGKRIKLIGISEDYAPRESVTARFALEYFLPENGRALSAQPVNVNLSPLGVSVAIAAQQAQPNVQKFDSEADKAQFADFQKTDAFIAQLVDTYVKPLV